MISIAETLKTNIMILIFLYLEFYKVVNLFSIACHNPRVMATTGQPDLITNKRDVPSVRYLTFSTKQTAISAS